MQEDRTILIICMSIALIFWFFTKMGNEYTSERTVNVRYDLPEGLAFSELPADKLTATLKGKGWDLMYDYLFGNMPDISINLKDETARYLEQTTLLNRIEENSLQSRRLTIKKTDPPFLYLNYEPKISKKIPVQLNQEITLAQGHFMTAPILFSVDSVTISGARKILDTIAFWITEPLILENVKSSGTHSVSFSKHLEKLVEVNRKKVEISLSVEEFTQNKVIAPILVKNTPDSLRIFPENIQISFSLPLSKSGTISRHDFQLEANFKDVEEGGESSTLPVILASRPNGLRALNYNPKSIRFWVIDKESIVQQDSLNSNQDSLINSSE